MFCLDNGQQTKVGICEGWVRRGGNCVGAELCHAQINNIIAILGGRPSLKD